MLSSQFTIPAGHPSLPGHFPGHPITPGVVTLDYVARGLLEQTEGMYVAGFPQVKFLRPVLPGVEVHVVYTAKKDNIYQFVCQVNGEKVLAGQLRLKAMES